MSSLLFRRWCGPHDHWNYGCYYHLSTGAIIGIVFASIALFLLLLFLCVVCTRRGRYRRRHSRTRDEESEIGGSGIRGGGWSRERTSRGHTRKSSRRTGRKKRVRRFPDPY